MPATSTAVLLALIGTAQAVVMTRRRLGAAAAAGLAAQAPPARAADDDLPTLDRFQHATRRAPG